MFVRNYRGVVAALVICALFVNLLASGHSSAAGPWIDGVLIALIAFVFVRIWLSRSVQFSDRSNKSRLT